MTKRWPNLWCTFLMCAALVLSSCTSPTNPPLDLQSTAGEGFVRLTWEPADPSAVGYVVWRSQRGASGSAVEVARLGAGVWEWVDDAVVPGEAYRYSVTVLEAGLRAPPTTLRGAAWHQPLAGVAVGEAEPDEAGVTVRVLNDGGYALPFAEVVWWVETGDGVVVWRGMSGEDGVAVLQPTQNVVGSVGAMSGWLWVVPPPGSVAAAQLRNLAAVVGEVVDLNPRDPALHGVDLVATRSGVALNHRLQVAVPAPDGLALGPGFIVDIAPMHVRAPPGVYPAVLTGYRYSDQRAVVAAIELRSPARVRVRVETAELESVDLRPTPAFDDAMLTVSVFTCLDVLRGAVYRSRACPGDDVIEVPPGSYAARAVLRTRQLSVDWIYTFAREALTVGEAGRERNWPLGEAVTLSLSATTTQPVGPIAIHGNAFDADGNQLSLVERREDGITIEAELLVQLFNAAGALVGQQRVAWRDLQRFEVPLPAGRAEGEYRIEVVASVGPVARSPLRASVSVEIRDGVTP